MSKILSREEFSELFKAGPVEDAQIRKEYVTSAAVDVDKRTVKFVVSTGDVDRDDDVVNPKGWDLADYKKSPVVLWAHDHECPPIAKATSITTTAKGLVSVAQFPEKGIYPFADMIFELIKGGFINSASVGFKPIECAPSANRKGFDFQKQSLLEWSIVPVPANPNALMAASAAGVDLRPMQKWLNAVLTEWPSDDLPLTVLTKTTGTVTVNTSTADDIGQHLKASVETLSATIKNLQERVDALSAQTKTPDGTPEELFLDIDDAVDEEVLDMEPAEIKAAIADAVTASMQELAAEATRRAINHMRGRLD